MRCSTRVVAAVGALVAGSGSIVGEAFLVSPPASFHSPVAHGQNNDNKLRFAGGNARCLTVPALATPLPKASWRQKTLLRCSATPMRNIFTFGTKSFASRESRRYPYRRPRSAATATPSMSSSSEYGGLRQRNPLRRDDAERARLNEFITILVKTPVPEWKPALFEEYLPSLLKGNLYKQTMLEMLAKVRSGEEHETLSNVDAYLSGFLSQEKRKASRKMVRVGRTTIISRAPIVDRRTRSLLHLLRYRLTPFHLNSHPLLHQTPDSLACSRRSQAGGAVYSSAAL